MSYQRKRDFLDLLGMRVYSKKTNLYKDGLDSHIEVEFPKIQALIPQSEAASQCIELPLS